VNGIGVGSCSSAACRTKRKFRPRCCAKTRAGAPCIMRAVPGKRRCRFYGGAIDRSQDHGRQSPDSRGAATALESVSRKPRPEGAGGGGLADMLETLAFNPCSQRTARARIGGLSALSQTLNQSRVARGFGGNFGRRSAVRRQIVEYDLPVLARDIDRNKCRYARRVHRRRNAAMHVWTFLQIRPAQLGQLSLARIA
jgi:hypothetical protein